MLKEQTPYQMKFKLLFILLLLSFKSFSQDKDLNYFIEKGQRNSPFLTDLQNQIKMATLDSLVNKASNKTQISGNFLSNFAPSISNFGYDVAVTNGQVVSGLIGINKKILSKSTVASQANAYKMVKDGLIINKKIALKDLKKAITTQYISASSTANQIVFNEKLKSLLLEEALVLKKLTQNAVYKQTDYLIFSATVQQQELIVLQLRQQYQNDLGILNYISGEIDTTFIALAKPEIQLKKTSSLNEMIFFKPFEIDSLKIKNQDKLLDNFYKPSISLLGDAGYLSSFALESHKNFGFSVGLGISIPIYDGNQRNLQHQKNQLNLGTNFVYKTTFQRQYQQQLLLLHQKLKQILAINLQLKSQLTTSESLIEANRKLLPSGDAQITEFVIAIGNLIAIQNAIAQNNNNNLQVINELNYWSIND